MTNTEIDNYIMINEELIDRLSGHLDQDDGYTQLCDIITSLEDVINYLYDMQI